VGELRARHVSSPIPNGWLTVLHMPDQTPASLQTATWGNVLARRADVAPFVSIWHQRNRVFVCEKWLPLSLPGKNPVSGLKKCLNKLRTPESRTCSGYFSS